MKIKLIGFMAEVVEEYEVDSAYLLDRRQINVRFSEMSPDRRALRTDTRTFEQDSEHPHLYLEVR